MKSNEIRPSTDQVHTCTITNQQREEKKGERDAANQTEIKL